MGIEIRRECAKRLIKISQHGYTAKVIEHFRFKNAGSLSTPVEVGLYRNRTVVQSKLIIDVPYREAVGSLLFAARVT